MKAISNLVAGLVIAGAVHGAAAPAMAGDDEHRFGGLYVGGSLGGAWSDVAVTNAGPGVHYYIPGSVYQFDNSGWLAGGHIGFNHQIGHWVLGVEASLSGGDLDQRLVAPGVFATNSYRTDIEWIFTGTARVGYTWDKLLTYVKGGYASGKVETFATEVPAFDHSGFSEETHHGWTVGAGIEYLIMPNVVIGAEYNYLDLGAKVHRGVDLSNFDTYDVRVDPGAVHALTARLSFKLGRPEAREE